MKLTLAIVMIAAAVCAQTPPPAKKTPPPPTVTSIYDAHVRTIESEMVPLAEAMPADKYDFVPTGPEFKTVRTFAMQVKHVAAVNYIIGAAILQQDPPVNTNGEKGPDSIASKDDVVKFLKDSFAYVHKAAATINAETQLKTVKSPFGGPDLAIGHVIQTIAWHGFDHYGQMAIFARMNGIVPPASR